MYRIEKLDHKGRGITFIDGKITFIENALPNEIVDVKLILQKKKFNEAKILKIIEKSIDRVDSICPYFKECGGCDLLHLKYENQLEYKKMKVLEILKRYASIQMDIDEFIQTDFLYYRNKVTFQVKEEIGFYHKKSYDLIPIEKCFMIDSKINDLLKKLKLLNLENITQIMIRSSKFMNETMIVFKLNGELKIDINELDVDSIVCYRNGIYQPLKGKDYILEQLEDLKFIISPDSFFQVNSVGALRLYQKVFNYASLKGDERILDLFCGTGTIGLFLARFCSKVVGVEINSYAVEDAKKNALINDIHNIEFICKDVSSILLPSFDLVIVDPPRSGLPKKTIDYLLSFEIEKMIYVSCDPMTLARDLKLLSEKYEVNKLSLVDMFPNTYHVECVCILNRR